MRVLQSVRRPGSHTAEDGHKAVVPHLSDVGRRLPCKIGIHRYRQIWDYELPKHFKKCRVCGKRTVSGWPERALP